MNEIPGKTWFILTVAVASLLGLYGFNFINTGTVSADCVQGNGKESRVERKHDSFTKMKVSGAFEISVSAGRKQALSVTADKNIVDHIVTKVVDGTLIVESDTSVCPKIPVRVAIEVEKIIEVEADGANDIKIAGLDGESFTVREGGAGSINISGKTKMFAAVVSGAASLDAQQLKAELVRVVVEDAANALVFATESLDATARGTAAIYYQGNPSKVSQEISEVGFIAAQ